MPLADLNDCLFCGVELTDETRTREDVFPKWLQRDYGIKDMELTLLNGTRIRYRDLLVPACAICNNVHASQLEQRIKEQRATDQDMWIWQLKLMLGALSFESTIPWSSDDPENPVIDADMMALGFLHTVFGTLKVNEPQYQPDPLGSVFSFPTTRTEFFFADNLYSHPDSGHEMNYAASCICIHGRCWISLFDDAGQVQRQVDTDELRAYAESGVDPVLFYPEILYLRSQLDYMPQLLALAEDGKPAQGVMFLPPMSEVPVIPHNQEVKARFVDGFFGPGGFVSVVPGD